MTTLARVKDDFVNNLLQTGNVSQACELSELPRSTAYHLRNTDPVVADAWNCAFNIRRDLIRDQVLELALVAAGRVVEEPLTDANGQPVLDDDFEPLTVKKWVDGNGTVLAQLINKHIAGEVEHVQSISMNVNRNIGAREDEAELRADAFEIVDDAEEAEDAEYEEVGDDR